MWCLIFIWGFFLHTVLKISIIYLNFEIRKCSCCVNTLQQVFACYYIYPIMGNYHSVMYFKITAILFLFFEIISLYVVFLSVFTSAYDWSVIGICRVTKGLLVQILLGTLYSVSLDYPSTFSVLCQSIIQLKMWIDLRWISWTSWYLNIQGSPWQIVLKKITPHPV